MEVRILSENDILQEDIAQYWGHRMEKDSGWQRITKGGVEYVAFTVPGFSQQ